MTAETEHPAIIADSADMTEDTATTASAKAGTLAAGPSGAETAKPDTQQGTKCPDAAEGVYYRKRRRCLKYPSALSGVGFTAANSRRADLAGSTASGAQTLKNWRNRTGTPPRTDSNNNGR